MKLFVASLLVIGISAGVMAGVEIEEPATDPQGAIVTTAMGHCLCSVMTDDGQLYTDRNLTKRLIVKVPASNDGCKYLSSREVLVSKDIYLAYRAVDGGAAIPEEGTFTAGNCVATPVKFPLEIGDRPVAPVIHNDI